MYTPLFFALALTGATLTTAPLATRPSALPAAGTSKLTITGKNLNINGSFPTTRCADPFIAGGSGIVFETKFKGGRITFLDDTKRQAGAQRFVTQKDAQGKKGTMSVMMTMENGDSYVLASDPGTATLSPTTRQLTFDVRMRDVVDFTGSRGIVRVQGSFNCQ